MTLLALFPRLFKNVMDPLVDSYNGNQEKLYGLYEEAVTKMRKFVIEVVLATLVLTAGAKLLGV